MERGVNYIVVGLCFIITLIGLVVFIFWFGGNDEFGRDVKSYKAYSKVAIDGIKPNSFIKYKGISIGKVANIQFRNDDFNEIEFDLIIRKDIPIKKDSFLKVDQNGLLGSNFLHLMQNDESKEILNENEAMQIKISSMAEILESAPNLTGKIDVLLSSANQIINQENTKNIANILISIRESADKLNKLMSGLEKRTQEISSLIKNVDEISTTANTMIKTINKKVDDGEYDVKDILTPSLISIERSMQNINNLAKDGSILLNNLKENPYNTIFGYREEK